MTIEPDVSFGERLRRLREAAGLTQEALAERAGVTPDAIGVLERGARRHPYPTTVRALAAALGVSNDERAALLASVPRRGAAAPLAAPPQGVPPVPLPPTPLIGRDQEVEQLDRLLRSGAARVVTLTGPGGVGKTRLALEVAAHAAAAFPAGAAVVWLAALGDAALVVPALARALGLVEGGGQPIHEVVRAYLQQRRMLVMLDNFEQVLEAAGEVAALLAACADLAVLVTSRAPLRVRGEHEVPVRPLPTPALDRVPDPGDLHTNPAVHLFLERARAVVPAFELSRRNAAAVAAICRRLDGLPLALELAAARVRVLSPTELLARLDRALPLLTGGARDLPERQRTMRAAIAWSYKLLREPERRLLNRLAVFRGAWLLEAAEAVGPGGDVPEEAVFDLLSRLVEQSLALAETGDDGSTRYRMLVPVREYAEERLEQSGEGDETRRRHAGYFLHLAERAELALTGPTQVRWLERLDRENDNLRAALGWTIEADADLALRLAGALWLFWRMRGHLTEGRRWVEEALVAAPGASAFARARALSTAGWLAYDQANYEAAGALHEAGAALFRDLGALRHLADTLTGLGLVSRIQGDLDRAAGLHEAALQLFEQVDDENGIAAALNSLGLVVLDRGAYERARRLHEESLARFRGMGDGWGASFPLRNLARGAWLQREYGRAADLFREGLALSCELGDKEGAAGCLEGMAAIAAIEGQPERAARLLGAAEALLEAAGAAVSPPYRWIYERDLDAARSLIDAAWTVAWTQGREMALDEAAEYALCDPAAAQTATGTLSSEAAERDPLTNRERALAVLVSRGLTNRQIAQELVLADRTVETHVRNILRKLGLRSRAQIAVWVTERRLA